MTDNYDVPSIVWSWKGKYLFIVWGRHALRHVQTSWLSKKNATANQIRCQGDSFQVIVWEKGTPLQNAIYGGQPVLCYDILSSTFDPSQMLHLLLQRYKQQGHHPHVWLLNPQLSSTFKLDIPLVTAVQEGVDPSIMANLFGSLYNKEQVNDLLQKTNAAPIVCSPVGEADYLMEPFSFELEKFDY